MTSDSPLLTGGRVRSRDGTSLGYLALGDGPTVLCVHGALATGTDWLPVARLLAGQYRFVLVDRRGHGSSDVGVEGNNLNLEIEDLEAMVKQTGPIHALLAHSFGAVFILHALLTTALADQIGSLVLYDPPLMLDPAEAEHQVATAGALVSAGNYEQGVMQAVKLMLSLTDHEVAQLRRGFRGWANTVAMAPALMVQAAAMSRLGRVVEPFREVHQPTLLVLGELSRDVFSESIDALATVMPNTRKIVLHGQGHAALSGSPETLASEIGSFLNNPEAAV